MQLHLYVFVCVGLYCLAEYIPGRHEACIESHPPSPRIKCEAGGDCSGSHFSANGWLQFAQVGNLKLICFCLVVVATNYYVIRYSFHTLKVSQRILEYPSIFRNTMTLPEVVAQLQFG